jgi:DNA-directed RNA polymerase subunit H
MTEEQLRHVLVPKHEKISDKEKQALLAKYNISSKELPKIDINDAAISHLGAQPGDVIKITRDSPTAGTVIFYRGVMNE